MTIKLSHQETARITTIRADRIPISLLVFFMSEIPFLIIYEIIIIYRKLNFSLKS